MSSTAARSLTDRRPSNGSATTPRATDQPPLPPISPPVPSSEIDSDIGEPVPSPPPEEEETPRQQKKSPLLTAHRLSTSSLDEVNLAGPKDEESTESRDQATGSPPEIPPKDSPKQNFSLQGLSSSLPWGQQAQASKGQAQHSQMPPPQRKLTSPFSWLSRSSTTPKSPPLPVNGDRRNTAASVSTVGSNPDLLPNRLQDGQDTDSASLDSRTKRSSLKDQFKMLRMREEAGITMDDHESVVSTNGAPGGNSVGSPDSIAEEQDGETEGSPAPATTTPPATTSPSGIPTTVNPNLAPGTVSGISASASDASAPVDWEVWQQIVNHGPQALSGSDSEELNAAIKRGIPQTLRGVIWQVLADSRNPELEETYKDLVARGTEKERERHLSTSSTVTLNGHTSPKEKESLASSRSSLQSGASTPATHSNAGVPSPTSQGKDAESVAAAEEALEAVRKKKAKDDAVALQKLEKAIKRDLGSRTSYSKYFLSQKNQDGLFGLCKAYALYDEGVGYTQGLNFIVMPLLFNVSMPENIGNSLSNHFY